MPVHEAFKAAAFLFVAVAASVGIHRPAAAAMVTSYDPTTVATALQEAGYKAKISKDDKGTPRIESASEGNKVLIAFAGCQDGKSCDQIEFVIAWNCTGYMKKCIDVHNQWNSDELFSKTMITGNSIVIYRHLLLDKTGITADLLIRNLTLFSDDAVSLQAKF